MSPLEGEPLGVVTNWPPSLPAALQRWGTTHPKSPCLTALDNAGKPVYTLTYGRYQLVEDFFSIINSWNRKKYDLLSSILCGFLCMDNEKGSVFVCIAYFEICLQTKLFTVEC